MSNLFEVGMWVRDMNRNRIAKIVEIGKELIRLEVTYPHPYPYQVPQHALGITICSDTYGSIESWNAFVWDIDFLTEQEKLEVMIDRL